MEDTIEATREHLIQFPTLILQSKLYEIVYKQANRTDYRTGQDRTRKDKIGQERTGQDRTGQDKGSP